MSGKKEEITKFLKHIGDDYSPDETVEIWAECKGQGKDDETCPDHEDCGICRFEYMKRKGWLSLTGRKTSVKERR